MFKPSRIATAVLAAAGAALITSTPALADDSPPQLIEGGIQAANNYNHALCACPVPETGGQQLAVVPVGGKLVGEHRNNLVNVDGGWVDGVVRR